VLKEAWLPEHQGIAVAGGCGNQSGFRHDVMQDRQVLDLYALALHNKTARSMAFCNSRTLPGQS
jgi:hypothetical protein